MDGEKCLSVVKALKDISIDVLDVTRISTFGEQFPNVELLHYIYINSKIDLENYYKMCANISYKTSNNQEIIDRMPYYVFNNFMVFLTEIIDIENGKKPGDANSEETPENLQQKTMADAKSMLSNVKSSIPKIPKK